MIFISNNNLKSKNVVAGLGEIGKPIYQLISKKTPTLGFDLNKNLIDQKSITKYKSLKTSLLHICIPFSSKFSSNVISHYKKFEPEIIVIHSTVSPYTTHKLQQKLSIPIIYSATRGVHRRMLSDLKKYTKFFAIEPKVPKAIWAAKQ